MRIKLKSLTLTPGGNDFVPFDPLPPKVRVREIMIHSTIVGTKDAADALAAANFAAWLSTLKLTPWANVYGVWLRDDNKRAYGRRVSGGTAVPGSGTSFSVTCDLWVRFWEKGRDGKTDGSVPSELLRPLSMELHCAAAAVFAVGNLVITSVTSTIEADVIEGEGTIPEMVQMGFYQPGSLTINIPPGFVYGDLWGQDGLGVGSITPAEISQFDLTADGQIQQNNRLHAHCVAEYNKHCVSDLAEEQAFATPEFLDIVSRAAHEGQFTKMLAVESGGVLDLTGTITTPTICYRRKTLRGVAAVQAAATAQGVSTAGKIIEPQVASKSAVRAQHDTQRNPSGEAPKKARMMFGGMALKLRSTETPGSVARPKAA
jgi:hypothetical protein